MRENIKTISLIFIGLIICIIIYNYTKTPKESYDNSKKHLLFIHIPKTGGIALLNTKFFKDYVDSLSHHDSLKKEYPYKNNYNYVFTSVRNPYSRLVSAYFYLKKGGRDTPLDLGYQKVLEPYNTFESFVKHLKEKPELIDTIIHLEPQINFIFDDDLGFLVDDILYTESLAEDYFVLCEKYSDICNELVEKNTTKHDDYTKYYTPELQDIVYNIYKDDFQKLGYSYDF